MSETVLFIAAGAVLTAAVAQICLTWIGWRRGSPRPADAARPGLTFDQLVALERRLAGCESLVQRLREREPAAPARAEPAYEVAANLARRGAGVEALMTTCGLARPEAQLMLRLYGRAARDV